RQTADEISDRLLAGSVLAIAEQVFVNDDGELEVDVPYVALQMLTSSADDRVFYRIETLEGAFITGYRQLVLANSVDDDEAQTQFFNSVFRGSDIRIATFVGAASSSTKSVGYRVGVAETTNARTAIASRILLRSAARQSVLIAAAALLVWLAVTNALKPLSNLKRAIDRRNPEDMRPIKHRVPLEVEGIVERINDLLGRFSSSIDALRNFTSNASHQFRTPLALINTHLELAQRADTESEKAQSIHNAQKAVGDAERLMGQMLLLSRIDTLSGEELQSQSCDLTAIARDVCEEFILRLSHQADMDFDLGFQGDGQVVIKGDKTLVQEVVRNLIDNAIKHSGPTPRVDVIVAHSNCDPGSDVDVATKGVLFVRDQGMGFDLRTVLRNSMRHHPTTSSSNETHLSRGAGIGLTIVHEIVNLLGGQLSGQNQMSSTGMTICVAFEAK
ncbi:MAG: sensor histidine kinase, partial [Pseudomonadota bacterium]